MEMCCLWKADGAIPVYLVRSAGMFKMRLPMSFMGKSCGKERDRRPGLEGEMTKHKVN
jgi:hypothetical protein